MHLTSDKDRTALEECDELLSAIRHVVGQQRLRAQSASLVIVGASSSIPVLLLLSTQYLSFYLGKLVPALLAALSAALAILLQLTEPHARWQLLRRYEGLLEDERYNFLHRLEDYVGKTEEERNNQLLNRVRETHKEINTVWTGKLPENEGIKFLQR